MKIRKAALAAVVAVCLGFAGCNAYQTAQKAHDIVAAVVSVAQADLPSLQAAGVFSASDATAVGNYLSLTTTLDSQYQTCINTANSATLNTKSKFVACLDTFATGLANPQELAQLRLMSPKAQQEVQLWITAASVGVSSVVAALGGQPVAAPQVSMSNTADIKLAAAQRTFNRRVEAVAGL